MTDERSNHTVPGPPAPRAREADEAQDLAGRIVIVRGRRVMLDVDLAAVYGVAPKRLNEQVRRNRERFPDDFAFQLTLDEARVVLASRSQSATLKRGQNLKYAPHVFTEHGAVMLAAVLKSPIAIDASIQVVRALCAPVRWWRGTRSWPSSSTPSSASSTSSSASSSRRFVN